MSIDAKFDKIQKIVHHENADSLDIAIVSNFPCIVRKGEFKEGEYCFYIRDDAKLLEYDAWKEWSKSMSEGGIGSNEFSTNFSWQVPLFKYLGSGGRVKTCTLRGKVSMGILLKTNIVCPNILKFDDDVAKFFNSRINDSETGSSYLEKNFGIVHWEAPIRNIGSLNVAYQGLPFSLAKSDETNWENLDEEDLHLGSKCLVTKKFDGSSTTVTCKPDGTYEVSSRSMTFKLEEDESKMNAYQKLTIEVVKAGLWWAKKHNEPIAFRGEACCGSFNKTSYNKDCTKNNFFIYGCNFPMQKNWFLKHGTYGTENHFLKIVDECNSNGFNLKHVDVLETDVVVTKDLLKKYNDMPWNFGEGVVLNIKVDDINALMSSFVWDYKSKSREYLMKIK